MPTYCRVVDSIKRSGRKILLADIVGKFDADTNDKELWWWPVQSSRPEGLWWGSRNRKNKIANAI